MDTAKPGGTVAVNAGASRTRSMSVTLSLDATDPVPGSGMQFMRIMNAGGAWTAWEPYAGSKPWTLTKRAGKKTVYVEFRDAAGNISEAVSDTIAYKP